jgi:hypothetical protein
LVHLFAVDGPHAEASSERMLATVALAGVRCDPLPGGSGVGMMTARNAGRSARYPSTIRHCGALVSSH